MSIIQFGGDFQQEGESPTSVLTFGFSGFLLVSFSRISFSILALAAFLRVSTISSLVGVLGRAGYSSGLSLSGGSFLGLNKCFLTDFRMEARVVVFFLVIRKEGAFFSFFSMVEKKKGGQGVKERGRDIQKISPQGETKKNKQITPKGEKKIKRGKLDNKIKRSRKSRQEPNIIEL